MTTPTYLIVSAIAAADLASRINVLLMDDWKLHGAPFANGSAIFQALTRITEQKRHSLLDDPYSLARAVWNRHYVDQSFDNLSQPAKDLRIKEAILYIEVLTS